jgi:hypothetical protein
VQGALARIAPYKDTGLPALAVLQRDFRTLAPDIVAAKLEAQDATLRDKAMARLSRLVKIRRVDNLEGDSADAVVARAQLALDKGDARGALQELRALQGASADRAAPWMRDADAYAAGVQVSDLLSQTILQLLAGAGMGGVLTPDTLLQTLKNNIHAADPSAAPYISPALLPPPTKKEEELVPPYGGQ